MEFDQILTHYTLHIKPHNYNYSIFIGTLWYGETYIKDALSVCKAATSLKQPASLTQCR